MSKRAEERALEAYPVLEVCSHANGPYDTFSKLDVNKERRNCYQQGYEQAEKDLGWHSVDESLPPMDEQYKEVLQRFINIKNEQHQ